MTKKTDTVSFKSLHTVAPAQLAEEMTYANAKLRQALGDDPVGYVANRLNMNLGELAQALAVEQVEGVALALYNIEARGQALIIGDQTGIGKGRQAAALIRYGIHSGFLPIFLTDRYTLFSDMYRDCKALGIPHARPLIVNSNVSIVDFDKPMVDIKMAKTDEVWTSLDDDTDDEDIAAMYSHHYEQVYKSPKKKELEAMYDCGDIDSERYDYMMLTYSQLKDARRDRTRLEFLKAVCQKRRALFVFDEAHRSSSVSDGKVSVITQCINDILEVSPQTQCVFLSATFAKRPESLLTFMQQTMLNSLATSDTLQKAFANGGVPMQEYVAARLAREGQMIRREHSGKGIPDPTYTYLDSQLRRHSELFDAVMRWFRELIALSDKIKDYVKMAKALDVETFRPYPTRQQLFYVNKILLLSLKAADVADAAVREVHAGRSVVIGMSDTLECVLRDSADPLTGKCSRGDFSTILLRLLQKTLSNPHDPGMTIFDLDLSAVGRPDSLLRELAVIRAWADKIEQGIRTTAFHLPMSPIDVIRQLITAQGLRFEECTGRAHQLEYDSPQGHDDFVGVKLTTRKKRHTSHIYNDFQNNKLDVILVNATGAIGASAHATVTAEVPEEQVRQRKMLIVQNDLDVNIDLQKRGRINRTGQVESLPPLYEYIITAIPSEKRLNMMLRAKLRSLSANTTANQDQEQNQADFIDITNKYGNAVTQEFLAEKPSLAITLGLGKGTTASQLLARTAMLGVADQQEIIDDIFAAYQNLEQELRRLNQWDLEREHRDFEAEFVEEELFSSAIDRDALGGASMIGTFRCRHRTFPYDAATLQKAIKEAQTPYGAWPGKSNKLLQEIKEYYKAKTDAAMAAYNEQAQALVTNILNQLVDNGAARQDAIDVINKYAGYSRITQKKAKEYLHGCRDPKEMIGLLLEFHDNVDKLYSVRDRNLGRLYTQEYQLRSVLERTEIGRAYHNVHWALPLSGKYDKIYVVLKEVRFGKKAEHRFLPSKVQFVFALSAEHKEVAINLSDKGQFSNLDRLNRILYASEWKFNAKTWNQEIAKYNNRLLNRKIITGNILGAFANPVIADMQPRFITFTLAADASGQKAIERGLLLPMSGVSVSNLGENVTIPLADGLKYANANYKVYPISGVGVDISISPQRGGQDNKLSYYVSVNEKDSGTFELDRHYDAIRRHFRKEIRYKTVRYVTNLLAYNSPQFMEIMTHLASQRAMIVIPKNHLTVGDLKKFAQTRKNIDNSNWPILDWKNSAPGTIVGNSTSPPSISLPEITDTAIEYVDEIPPGVLLCERTLDFQGMPFSTKGTTTKLRDLYLEWSAFAKKCTSDGNIQWTLAAQNIAKELFNILKEAAPGNCITFTDFTLRTLTLRVERTQLSAYGKTLRRFNSEMLLLSPPKEEVQAFLDDCICDTRLNKIRQSLLDYLAGKTALIL